MLNFVLGRAKSGKTAKLFEIARKVTDKEVIFIVPEQYSFTAEKAVLNAFGSVRCENISVLSFSGICTEISRLYGGRNGRVIDANMRYMLIQKTMADLKGELRLLNADKNTVSAVVDALTELKQTGAESSKFMSIIAENENSPLALKLHDITLIGKHYDALIADIYIDPLDDLEYALESARNNGYFKNKHVIFDGFSAFTGRQFTLINQIIIDADEVDFAFCTDYDCSDEFGIFANINKTVQKICDMAHNQNVAVNFSEVLMPRFKTNDANEIENSFFGGEIAKDNSALSIISAQNKYDETEAVANIIHRLVRTENYRFRDFTVIARNSGDYVTAIKDSFKKYEIPVFCDKTVNLAELPISAYIGYAIRASRTFNTKEVYKFLKSGLTSLTANEISQLDEYVFLWDINGKDGWLNDFTANPYGVRDADEEKRQQKLKYLNELRKKAINPLIPLSKISVATAKEFCETIFSLIEKNNLANNYFKLTESLRAGDCAEYATCMAGSWESINNILDGIYLIFGEQEMSAGEFYDIFENCVANCELRAVPQSLDDVITVDADRLISSDRKITFVLGNNYDEFPKNTKNCGFFSVSERAFLKNYGIEISDKYISDSINEEYLLYRAYTSFEDKLYLTYHNGDYRAGKCEISPNLQQFTEKFKISVTDASSIINSVETKAQLFSVIAKNAQKHNCDIFKSIMADYAEFADKLPLLDKNDNLQQLSADTANKLYANNLSLSATKVEKFYECKYKYFLKYGLRLNPREQIAYTGMQRGTIAHYVLEKAIKNDFEFLCKAERETVCEIVDKYVREYLITAFDNADNNDGYKEFLIQRISEMLYSLLPQITDELSKSDFKPEAFELNFGTDGDLPPITVTADNGTEFKLDGAIDRVDTYSDGVKKYIRITDYKTGVKTFNLSDILYGLNLQLFIYLCAISDNNDTVPAAAVYQPINPTEYNGINAKPDIAKPKGILLAERDILDALDPTAQYLPFKFTKKGELGKTSNCIASDGFKAIIEYTKSKLRDMANDILNGKIDNNAHSEKICKWCDYRSICNKCEDDFEDNEKFSNEEVLKMISKEDENGI